MGKYAYLKNHHPRRKLSRSSSLLLSATFLFLGLFLLAQVTLPLAGWFLFVLPAYSTGIVSPLSSNFRPEDSPLYPAIVRASDTISSSDDSYRPSSWFQGVSAAPSTDANPTYQLSIPALQIDSANVEFNGTDLKKSLVAWPTSVSPGNFGNIIIFGHSALPSLSSPKEYTSIFTHLLDLKEGDAVFLDYQGVRYRYEVTGKKVVSPTNLSVLEQHFDAAYLTIITCSPPGTLWMRAVVTARLTES